MEQKSRAIDLLITASFIGFVAFSIFSISLTQLFCAVGGIAWLMKLRLTGCRVRWPLGIPWLLFVLACVLAVVTAVDVGRSYKPLKKLLEIIIFFWTVNCLAETSPGDFFAWVGNHVAPGKLKVFFSWLEEKAKAMTSREFFFILLVVSVSVATLYGFLQALVFGVSTKTRVAGTLSIYMTFAGMLMMVGLMVLSRLLFGKTLEVWAGVVLGAIIFCLFLTLTRQAWVGFTVGAVFLLFLRERKWLLALPVLIILMQLVSPDAVNRRLASFANLKDETFLSRVALWRGGWEIFKDHPLTGCGFKCVDSVYSQYPEHAKILARYKGMHNNIIQLAVDTGIVGVIAWISVWVCYLFALYGLTTDRWVNLGCASVVLGFLAGGMFEVNFYDSEVVMLLYFLMALPFTAPGPGISGERPVFSKTNAPDFERGF